MIYLFEEKMKTLKIHIRILNIRHSGYKSYNNKKTLLRANFLNIFIYFNYLRLEQERKRICKYNMFKFLLPMH